jgi:hypothetical protein
MRIIRDRSDSQREEGSTLSTHRGHAALSAATTAISTPSFILELRNRNGVITSILTGYPKSHKFDKALSERIEANRKALNQDTLGQTLSSKTLSELSLSLCRLHQRDGNTAVIRSRAVVVMVFRMGYEQSELIDDVLAEVHTTPKWLT